MGYSAGRDNRGSRHCCSQSSSANPQSGSFSVVGRSISIIRGSTRAASVAYAAGSAAYQAWFNQPVTLKPGTRYNFSGWTKASSANPGCSVTYYVGNAAATSVLKTVGQIPSASLQLVWKQTTGFYETTTETAYTFDIRLTCSGSAARTYFMDDLELVEALS
ncbi:hypothetical protein B0H67DRAFT_649848 [Lasiosphaeris hirsuta]|uniref:Uncharacterized protein n=1 Tax=Lasiosphaeris hirsuta TaxID=260670 RepID=A0AA39ZXL5_9PEZI|nr:hypothetical protein B0H67DRAFT_649848 [Lasiosphaeris hirsuta]